MLQKGHRYQTLGLGDKIKREWNGDAVHLGFGETLREGAQQHKDTANEYSEIDLHTSQSPAAGRLERLAGKAKHLQGEAPRLGWAVVQDHGSAMEFAGYFFADEGSEHRLGHHQSLGTQVLKGVQQPPFLVSTEVRDIAFAAGPGEPEAVDSLRTRLRVYA